MTDTAYADPQPEINLKDFIRGVPDFPKPGILFYDISTLIRHADAWQIATARMARAVAAFKPISLPESRVAVSSQQRRLPSDWAAASSCCASLANFPVNHLASVWTGIWR